MPDTRRGAEASFTGGRLGSRDETVGAVADAQIPVRGRSRSVASRIATRRMNLCVIVLLTLQTQVVDQTLATTKDKTCTHTGKRLGAKDGANAPDSRGKTRLVNLPRENPGKLNWWNP